MLAGAMLAGALRYQVGAPVNRQFRLDLGTSGISVPEMPHRAAPAGDLDNGPNSSDEEAKTGTRRFFAEFWRRP